MIVNIICALGGVAVGFIAGWLACWALNCGVGL
jgi:hypothetical protein